VRGGSRFRSNAHISESRYGAPDSWEFDQMWATPAPIVDEKVEWMAEEWA